MHRIVLDVLVLIVLALHGPGYAAFLHIVPFLALALSIKIQSYHA